MKKKDNWVKQFDKELVGYTSRGEEFLPNVGVRRVKETVSKLIKKAELRGYKAGKIVFSNDK